MVFTLKAKRILRDYHLNGACFSKPDTVTDLCVIFDHCLLLATSIIIAQTFSMCRFIVRSRKSFTDIQTLKFVYHCFVRSKLKYVCVVSSSLYLVYASNLEFVQKRFPKLPLVLGTMKQHSFIRLGERGNYLLIVLLFKVINGKIDDTSLLNRLDCLRIFCFPRVYYVPVLLSH